MQDQVNPYAPPQAVVRDAVPDSGEFDMASRGSRLGAALLDGVVGFVAGLPAIIAVSSSLINTGGNPGALDPAYVMQTAGKAFAVSGLLYLALIVITIVLVSRNAQTIGKKLVGIKVARSDGSKATLGRIFWLRNVVNLLPSLIPFVGSIYGLVDILFIFGEKQQCLHDKIADTIVIRA